MKKKYFNRQIRSNEYRKKQYNKDEKHKRAMWRENNNSSDR